MKSKFNIPSVLVVIGCVFFLGMGGIPHRSYLKNEVYQILHTMAGEYSSENYENFISYLDEDFQNLDEFKHRLQGEFVNKKELELKFYVDNILEDRDLLFVGLHWFKKYRTNKGNIVKGRGSASFIFREGMKGYKLLFIRGDNPFF